MSGFEPMRLRNANLRCVFFVLASVLLPACAGLSSSSRNAGPTLERASRAYQDTVELSGRLSVRYQKDGTEEALHVNFTWQQSSERTLVSILSPTGQILATIEILPDSATLAQAGQAPRIAKDVDALTAQTLGWSFPVAGLRDWLQGFGVDGDGRNFVASPANGDTPVITKDGWRIQYVSWHDESGPVRPKRIDLERATTQGGNVNLRIVVDGW
ncbi:lipoprotein insertase outer membrane protein LolB [soil metagenome]